MLLMCWHVSDTHQTQDLKGAARRQLGAGRRQEAGVRRQQKTRS